MRLTGAKVAAFALRILPPSERIEGPLHVARGERLAIVKAHAVVQMKDVGQRIGNFPALRQPGLQVEVIVAADQGIEEQLVDALRLRVDADARIEVDGTALDDHDQRVGVGLAANTRRKR